MKKKSIMIGMLCTLLSVPMFAQDVVNSQTTPVTTIPTQRTDNAAEENQIAIVGFKRLENDVTARVRAPKRDQNGELCAIIKVVTKNKNLFFEPDALGITAREDQPGEIWLYVPYVALRPQFGFLKVTANTDKTDISVDGKVLGTAPFNSDTLQTGKHLVRAEREWYIPQEKEVEILPLERAEAEFKLKIQKPNIFLLAQLGNAIGDNKQSSFGLMAGICRKGGAGYLKRGLGWELSDGSGCHKVVRNDGYNEITFGLGMCLVNKNATGMTLKDSSFYKLAL
ncbi:MAG: PEGA domain-containing protein [Bacteroides sp.]|nr:PEGA domain-containing protein [Bacteroides sp.]